MIRLELDSTEQLMRIYQAIMAGKFSEQGETLLSDRAMSEAADLVMKQLIAETRDASNAPMADAMENMRNLSPDYPQYQYIMDYFANSEDWPDMSEEEQRIILMRSASPLLLDSQGVVDLAGLITQRRLELKGLSDDSVG
ncbi:Uncharacterised protein [BD1-7 clade bacterium]|uniref:Uncharacterized protein n=1 Tax=BD1-7 clade bacterium TaxID=2029982 RepID=A0A5S9PTN4_9GAMM|nr:Uncharacterised protein [BD1-7 clade bacterium]